MVTISLFIQLNIYLGYLIKQSYVSCRRAIKCAYPNGNELIEIFDFSSSFK